ncbi:MAG: NADH-quinone oxidoreductase subunit J [Miltoncostaeaceae bacterium]
MGEQVLFAVAAIGTLGFGVGVVFFKDAFRAAVSLIGTLLSVALLFVALLAPFAAAIQVIVYAGAIVVMFLFVIAYLGDRGALPGPDRLDRWQVFGWLGLIGLGMFGTVAILDSTAGPVRAAPETTDVGSPASIGDAFLSSHLLAFEVTSLVLLVAAVGAVILAKGAVQGEGGR